LSYFGNFQALALRMNLYFIQTFVKLPKTTAIYTTILYIRLLAWKVSCK